MTKYVTIIGVDLVQPLASLLEKFLSLPRSEDSQSRHHDERGYSFSICLLTSVIVESFAMRARYLNAEEESAKKRSIHEFLAHKYPDFEWNKELVEVFILRDVIAHNHLWEIESSSEGNIWFDVLKKRIHPLTDRWKDRKYRDYVEIDSARTKTLSLHVIPTQIERSDVLKVIKVAKETLSFLVTKEGSRLGIDNIWAEFRGRKMLKLLSILDEAIKAI